MDCCLVDWLVSLSGVLVVSGISHLHSKAEGGADFFRRRRRPPQALGAFKAATIIIRVIHHQAPALSGIWVVPMGVRVCACR